MVTVYMGFSPFHISSFSVLKKWQFWMMFIVILHFHIWLIKSYGIIWCSKAKRDLCASYNNLLSDINYRKRVNTQKRSSCTCFHQLHVELGKCQALRPVELWKCLRVWSSSLICSSQRELPNYVGLKWRLLTARGAPNLPEWCDTVSGEVNGTHLRPAPRRLICWPSRIFSRFTPI